MTASVISTVVMAGGQSSRMGTDKSFVIVQGKPMIRHVLSALDGLGDETFIITNTPDDYAHLDLPLHGDVYPDHGPLGGIYTALHYARHPHVLIVACDMPWLNRSLLDHLVSLRHTADVVVPRWDKYPEPMHAVYSQECLDPIAHHIQAKRLKITSFFGKVSVNFVDREEIARFDPEGRSFSNVNTPEDLAGAS